VLDLLPGNVHPATKAISPTSMSLPFIVLINLILQSSSVERGICAQSHNWAR
jgi:hypothetical protein